MKNAGFVFIIIIVIAVSIIACSKEVINQSNTADNTNKVSQLLTANLVKSPCDQFAYSDTIFFPASLPEHYIVKPLVVQAGVYGCFPEGLSINSTNGYIDITKSETGLEYIVWFVAKGTTDTCRKLITVSGVNYTDSIYVLANTTGITSPVYNANLLTPVDCKGGCEFDDGADDDNGNGIADEPPAGQEVIPQGIAINKATGTIDLKKSLQNGALGKNPKNGAFKDFILNYRIGDKSAKALNKINFRLYYYKTKAQIPASLKSQVTAKQNQVLLEGENEDEDEDGGHHGGHGSDFTIPASSGSTTAKNGQGEVKCRPPYIIVTQQ